MQILNELRSADNDAKKCVFMINEFNPTAMTDTRYEISCTNKWRNSDYIGWQANKTINV